MVIIMQILASIVAVIMILLSPCINFFASLKTDEPTEGNFTNYEEIIKPERGYLPFGQGENDIVLSEGESFSDAIESVKTARAGGDDSPVTIWLHGGKYSLSGTVNLSGVRDLTVAAYPGERVTLTEGTEISGWSETEVNGVKAWRADMPGGLVFQTLYKGDIPLSLSRYPESGYLTVKEPNRASSMFTEKTRPWEFTYGDRSFYYGDDLGITDFYNLKDVRIKLMHYWFCEITSVSFIENGILGVGRPCSMMIREGDRYFLQNVFEALKNPGEWYHDTAENVLYYIPEETDDINSTVLFAPGETIFFDIENCYNVSFNNIRFAFADISDPEADAQVSWLGQYGMLHPQGNLEVRGAVEIKESSNINFINCDFENIGNTGIRFSVKNTDCTVSGCSFKNIGCNAIFIDGKNSEDESEQTRRINITDNLIEGYGRNIPSGIGVLLTYAADCELSNNEVHDGYYTAFSVGWVWGYDFHTTDYIKIKNNLIYDIGQGWLSDMGGIYTLGSQPHTEISGNVIHNVAADPGEGGYGGWGIYLDEGSSHITVTKNLVYDCGSQSFHQHYGRENIISNNIFAFSGEGQIRVSKIEDHTEFDLTGNIIAGENQPLWVNAHMRNFTESGNLFWDYENFKHVYVLYDLNSKRTNRIYRSVLRLFGCTKDDVVADPLFYDASSRDFHLSENSPALTEIGFAPWNYAEAGTLSAF
ncbi:MAG: right-handed parallel beta-helix repeat-containing protein [Oscillospiraceae bacterium]|nr:right-handed parallel beta-helix repeat-containing protein [Oscillospiraceae bacterium]